MKRKKKYKHAYKCRQKLMLLVGATTMAVGAVTMGQVQSVHAEETKPEPIVTELKDSSSQTTSPTTGEEGQPSLSQTGNTDSSENLQETEAGLSAPKEARASTERGALGEGVVLIETSEKAAPTISNIVVNVSEEREYSPASVNTEITFEQVEQPAVVTHKLINKASGEAYVQTRAIEKRPHHRFDCDCFGGEIDTSIPETRQTAFAYFEKVPAGTYRLEVGLTDLENKPYTLDAVTLEKLNAQSEIVIKPYDKTSKKFVEPNLVEVKVNKTTVKKGENVVYTLIYDSLPEVSYGLKLEEFDYGFFYEETDDRGQKTGRSTLRFSNKFSEAGEKKLGFNTRDGYFIREDLEGDAWTWRKQLDISEANRNKLAQLMPTVTVLDEEYKPLEIISLTHIRADGSRSELAALDPSWSHSINAPSDDSGQYYHNRVLHKLQVGDQLVYKVKLSADYLAEQKKKKSEYSSNSINLSFDRLLNVQALGGTAFTFDEGDSLHLSSDQWETGELDMTFTVKDYMHGYLNLNRLGSGFYDDYHLAFGGYLFQIENPTYSLPTLAEIKKSDRIYIGENAAIKVKTSKLASISRGMIDLDFDIRPTSESSSDPFDHYLDVEYDYSNPTGAVATEWFRGNMSTLEDEHIGSYSLKRAKISFDGWTEEITNLPNWTLDISGDKVFKSNFLLSGAERTQVASIGQSWFYGSLGRLPKELQNRRLDVRKLQFYDRQGNNLPTVNADWVLSEYELREGQRLYYYLPSTGELTELKPVSEEGRRLVKGSKDSKGLYVFAMALEEDGAQPTENVVDTTKVLSGQVEDVLVSLSEADVSTVKSIQVAKVEDATVLEKLPESFKREDVDMFDIKTLDKDGQFVQIQSSKGAFVTLPVSPNRKVTKVIYYLPQTGAVEELEYEWDKTFNIVSFNVTHFSNYGIVYEALPKEDTSSEASSLVSTPAVSDSSSLVSTPAVSDSSSLVSTPAISDSSSSVSTPAVSDSSSLVSTPAISDSSSSVSTPVAPDSSSPVSNLVETDITVPEVDSNTSVTETPIFSSSVLVGDIPRISSSSVKEEQIEPYKEEVGRSELGHLAHNTSLTSSSSEKQLVSSSSQTEKKESTSSSKLPNTAINSGVIQTVLGLSLASLATVLHRKREE
ncbi:TPA: hypothetical protein UDO34_001834 [Streptococcus suis]|nr:hypothetical protein [Streptococcus suis]